MLTGMHHLHPEYPRIFISELRVKDLSEKAQNIIHSYTDEVTADPVSRINLDDAARSRSISSQRVMANSNT